jgi:hypothetical protein
LGEERGRQARKVREGEKLGAWAHLEINQQEKSALVKTFPVGLSF